MLTWNISSLTQITYRYHIQLSDLVLIHRQRQRYPILFDQHFDRPCLVSPRLELIHIMILLRLHSACWFKGGECDQFYPVSGRVECKSSWNQKIWVISYLLSVVGWLVSGWVINRAISCCRFFPGTLYIVIWTYGLLLYLSDA
jgi:hypothetical protein